jgi:hypothetical protein
MSAVEPDDPGLDALAGEPIDSTDLALLNSVRAFYDEHDPVPAGLVERIEFGLTLDALEAEVATLTQLDLAAAGARSTPEAVRAVTFTSDSITTMVTITPLEPGSVRVDGWATPGAGVRVELLRDDGRSETVADEDGRFVFARVPAGLARFALHLPAASGGATVLTPALEL